MCKASKVSLYPEKAYRVVAHLNDFIGTVEEWKIACYELWRYQMTWGFAHEILITESAKNGVFVSLLIRPSYKDNLFETMGELGFDKIDGYDDEIGVIKCIDLDDDHLYDYVRIEY